VVVPNNAFNTTHQATTSSNNIFLDVFKTIMRWSSFSNFTKQRGGSTLRLALHQVWNDSGGLHPIIARLDSSDPFPMVPYFVLQSKRE
jgi:hypothetical protein